ncbi:MAG: response regulator [Candidatus Altiarchaeota archaeon]|nr:response regulator [Candidatus Altiarchaeota archaeon]
MAKNIIIVDDEPHIAKAIHLALSGEGYNLRMASTANEAWKLVDKDTDLLLLDIMMPGMRSVDLIQTIKDHGLSKVKCIYVSAVPFTDDEMGKMVSEGIVADFIQKPFDNADLLKRVKKALGEL